MNDVMAELAEEHAAVKFLKVSVTIDKITGTPLFYLWCNMHCVCVCVCVCVCARVCVQVEAEEFPDLSLKYEIAAVPTFVFIKVCGAPFTSLNPFLSSTPVSLQGGKVVDRVNGAHVPELTKKTTAHSELLAPPPPAAPTEVRVSGTAVL